MSKWITRILRSKTMLFNFLVAGLASLEGVFAVLQPHIEANVFAILTVILTVGNAILRTVTTKPLADK